MRSPNRTHHGTHQDRGFTVIELLITVGIIGLLAAIAVPNFIAYQARSRRSEAYVNLTSIARTYKSYHAEMGVFPDMDTISGEPTLPDWTLYGSGDLGTYKMPWDAETISFFDIVGWMVEGKVFYSYDVNSVACGCGAEGDRCFTLTAYGDVDNDGLKSAVMYVHPYRDANDNVLGECGSTLLGLGTPLGAGGQPIYDQVAVQPTTDDY